MNRQQQMIAVSRITSPERAPGAAYPSSVLIAHGRLLGTPQQVSVVVDARAGYAMQQMLGDEPGTVVVVVVEDRWQIVGNN